MQPLLIAAGAGFLIGILVVGVPSIVTLLIRERTFRKAADAYERILDRADKDLQAARESLSSYMDRWYAAKNLPPSEVNMSAQYQERRAEERKRTEERRNQPPRPHAIGPADAAQDEMEQAVRRGQYPRSAAK